MCAFSNGFWEVRDALLQHGWSGQSSHYCLPPLERFELQDVLLLIAQQKYFVLHAPRQTGKTTCLLALMSHLNATDQYRCVYANVEIGQSARELASVEEPRGYPVPPPPKRLLP